MSAVSLPSARGPVTAQLFEALAASPRTSAVASLPAGDEVDEEDLHLALYCCYELHYRGLPGVSESWEWDPTLLSLRQSLEQRFETDLLYRVGPVETDADRVVDDLWGLANGGDGPSLSGWLRRHGTLAEARELAIHRSAYQLKEADPHTWAIPRLDGDAKAVMVAIQADEYGEGVASAMHSSLFAETMKALNLDATYGAYLDRIPGVTLATTNLISMFGLHRRLRGALVGHLALFEMSSVGPMGNYAAWMDRLGIDPAGRRFYDVHVTADEHHQHLASTGMVGGLVRTEPQLATDVLFGARALCMLEGRLAARLLQAFSDGKSLLRDEERALAG